MNAVETGNRIAEFAGLFSDVSRVRILLLLAEERRGMTTMDICTRLGLPQPRVSSHLSVLLDHGVVSVRERGRQRIHTLSSEGTVSVLNDLASFSPSKVRANPSTSPGALREVKNNSSIRQCRSCYDHIAGVVGVELLEKMLALGWLKGAGKESSKGRRLYRLTRAGKKSLRARGVALDEAGRSGRILAYGCMDWTEGRPHLGGALGSAILNLALADGVVERRRETRALRVKRSVSSWLGSD